MYLLYNKTLVDLCFGRQGVLLNSKLNHNEFQYPSIGFLSILALF